MNTIVSLSALAKADVAATPTTGPARQRLRSSGPHVSIVPSRIGSASVWVRAHGTDELLVPATIVESQSTSVAIANAWSAGQIQLGDAVHSGARSAHGAGRPVRCRQLVEPGTEEHVLAVRKLQALAARDLVETGPAARGACGTRW